MTIGLVVAIQLLVHFTNLLRNLGLSVLQRTYEPGKRAFFAPIT
jgi:hypothetical protein